MYLLNLSLTNFRNFLRLDIDVPRGPVLLVGGNAQGKTSLLEAIYYLATFVSFHASSDRQLVSFLAQPEPLVVTRIVADFRCAGDSARSMTAATSRGEKHRLEIRLIQESDGFNTTGRLRKELLLDGVKQKIGEIVGVFNAVLFLPQMMRVIEGGPDDRRRYLNLALSQVIPNYAAYLSSYSQVLSQRNALLKQLGERGGDARQLDYWDEQLAEVGCQIIYARIHAIRELERLASTVHHDLTRGQEILRFVYEPSFDPLPRQPGQYMLPLETAVDRSGISLEKIRDGLQECLANLRKEEISRGVTTVGPHRDELRFLGNEIDLGTFGSRGQGRTAVLSLKLAEVEWMKHRTGQWPVLLLDEVLAELDADRRFDLLSRMAACEQAFLTSTEVDNFSPEFVQKAHVWQVKGGRIYDQRIEDEWARFSG